MKPEASKAFFTLTAMGLAAPGSVVLAMQRTLALPDLNSITGKHRVGLKRQAVNPQRVAERPSPRPYVVGLPVRAQRRTCRP